VPRPPNGRLSDDDSHRCVDHRCKVMASRAFSAVWLCAFGRTPRNRPCRHEVRSARCCQFPAGKLTATVVPPPEVSDRVSSPPWALAILLHVASPRPVPEPSPSRWSRTKGSRALALSSGAIPLPLSATKIVVP